jgi:hypothetical protein
MANRSSERFFSRAEEYNTAPVFGHPAPARQFEEVIMVEVLIEEMSGSD